MASKEAVAQIELPAGNVNYSINVKANNANHWRQGKYEVWLLSGEVEIHQGDVTAHSNEAVLWIHRQQPLLRPTDPTLPQNQLPNKVPDKIITYLEGDVIINFGRNGNPHSVTGQQAQSIWDKTWLGRFHTLSGIDVRAIFTGPEPTVKPNFYHRAVAAREPVRDSQIRPAQFTTSGVDSGFTTERQSRRQSIHLQSRSGGRANAKLIPSPDQNESITVVDGGVRAVIEGVELNDLGDLGKIDIETDRLVIWGPPIKDLLSDKNKPQGEPPLEVYMEGNIVFRQGNRVIYADRMFYNVKGHFGVVLDAEMLTPAPEYEGLLRLKADVLQQLNQQHFQAFGAALTTSRLGVPRYWFQTENVTIQDMQHPTTDPITGAPGVDHQLQTTSRDNYLYVGGVPIFYWPVMAADLTKPTYYVEGIRIKSDSVFGVQLLTDWNAYQLLGLEDEPEGTDWTLSLDGLSDRGLAIGTNFEYSRENLFGIPGPYHGFIDGWGINEQGLDNLGRDRRALTPEEDFRGRLLWRHRQDLAGGYQLTGELGLVSDRNFLEQYYEREWDELKDQSTGLELKRYQANSSWSLSADARTNDFFTQTEWLPRFDHFLFGQSVGDRLTWHAHSSVGFARLRTATTPTDPIDAAKFDPLAWEANRQGLRAATRHELDWPIEAGPVKVVPYVLGELAHWEQDLTGLDVNRTFGQVGVRANLSMWKADPNVQNVLLNLNGLAHKVDFDVDAFWANSNQDLSRFPLYDPLDDDSVEHFRRRFFFDTFGGTAGGDVMRPFDERYFALRSGMQGSVAAASTEIADDLILAKMGIRQRWQTKRGLPGQERIIDWIVLDIEGSLFPDPDRDNFGQELGLFHYDFRWHIGDRLTLLSDGFADFFGDGLRVLTVGGIISRPDNGSLFLGARSIEGPISSNTLAASVNYRMTEKWIVTAGASVDLGPAGSLGQNISFTHIGESSFLRVGFNVDASRGNVGAVVMLEPRFLPNSRLGQIDGESIPPPGFFGFE